VTDRVFYVATSNPGKLRDFAAAAQAHDIEIRPLPGFEALPPVEEDGITFEQNATKKAEQYSLAMPGEIVIADDSGLEVEALAGAPGVLSARYAAMEAPPIPFSGSADAANNGRLLRELAEIPDEQRSARFICVIVAARDGKPLHVARGEANGMILRAPRGAAGFGYDPLFFYPPLGKSFAELLPEEKAQVSHRGKAFRNLREWIESTAEL
jgi:XTP/dITP diphosphohydrolase